MSKSKVISLKEEIETYKRALTKNLSWIDSHLLVEELKKRKEVGEIELDFLITIKEKLKSNDTDNN